MIKLPGFFKKLDYSEVANMNKILSQVFRAKLESIWKMDDSGITPYAYQFIERGEVSFSANGSAVITKTFSLHEVHPVRMTGNAHAMSDVVIAHVIDLTQTSITISLQNVSGGGLVSSNTTATVKVFYEAVGSAP